MTKVSSAGDLIAAKQCQRSTQQHRIHLQNKEKAPLALSSYKIDSSSLDEHQQVDGVNLTSANIFHHSHPPSTIRTDHRSTFTSDPVNWLVLIIISLLIYESAVLSNLEEWEKGKQTNIADVSFVFVDNAESRGKKPSAEEKQEEEEKRGKLEEEQ
ncbi:hypothetical protein T02_2437 [Trichinella nativa]|uniref:Uncharacterized protein n=1 Tax=Trichinella nativa TaxID=6335 RepID=A0A0V1KQT7_9BILA|nr:hypothetical protein T02_2437 [Trichinella nativa]